MLPGSEFLASLSTRSNLLQGLFRSALEGKFDSSLKSQHIGVVTAINNNILNVLSFVVHGAGSSTATLGMGCNAT